MQTQEIYPELRQRKTGSSHSVGTPWKRGTRETSGTEENWVGAQARSLTFARAVSNQWVG